MNVCIFCTRSFGVEFAGFEDGRDVALDDRPIALKQVSHPRSVQPDVAVTKHHLNGGRAILRLVEDQIGVRHDKGSEP